MIAPRPPLSSRNGLSLNLFLRKLKKPCSSTTSTGLLTQKLNEAVSL